MRFLVLQDARFLRGQRNFKISEMRMRFQEILASSDWEFVFTGCIFIPETGNVRKNASPKLKIHEGRCVTCIFLFWFFCFLCRLKKSASSIGKNVLLWCTFVDCCLVKRSGTAYSPEIRCISYVKNPWTYLAEVTLCKWVDHKAASRRGVISALTGRTCMSDNNLIWSAVFSLPVFIRIRPRKMETDSIFRSTAVRGNFQGDDHNWIRSWRSVRPHRK